LATKKKNSTTRVSGTPNMMKIRVRMYRVGFGDCFLLSLPSGSKKGDAYAHILIDFGVHSGADIGTMDKIIEDIAQVTRRKLAIIIATHAHQDHISGFGRYAELFSSFKIDQIWLPWTWDESNLKAMKLHEKLEIVAEELLRRFALLPVSPEREAAVMAVENLRGNKKSMHHLRRGFGDNDVKIRFLKAGDLLNSTDCLIPGLRVRVLGPPELEEYLKKMDPPDDDRYLISEPANDIALAAYTSGHLFGKEWIADSEYHALSQEDEETLQRMAEFSFDLAFSLDKARNNESLVTLFEFHGKNLLFTGDAQYGNWRWWIENIPSAEDILSNINFFKIAHHGSENATPVSALEKMADGNFVSMVSTQSKPWEPIPLVSLMARVNQKTKEKIVRSDWLDWPDAPVPRDDAQPTLPSKFAQGFTKGRFWFDYEIDLMKK
jgi:beta-lactamase superfamily II metal-dependent hydrolase